MLAYASRGCACKAGLGLRKSQIYVCKAQQIGLKNGDYFSLEVNVSSSSERSRYIRMSDSPRQGTLMLNLSVNTKKFNLSFWSKLF